MNGPSKEKIKEAMTKGSLYIGVPAEVDILKDAYKEAIDALKDAVSRFQQYEIEVSYYDAPYYHKNAMKCYTDIINKYPKEEDMKESLDCDCGVCSICNGQRKPGEVLEKAQYLYDPPSWMVCDRCNGSKWISHYNNIPCDECNGTGKIPIHYTPEQWEAAGGVLNGSTPVIVKFTTPDIGGCYYSIWQYGQVENSKGIDLVIIATSAGKPKER